MIRAQVFEIVAPDATTRIARFLIEGHAGSGEYGRDVVCAAVSALAINFVNSVEALCGHELWHEARNGYLDVRVTEDEPTQWLAKSLRVGLVGMAKEHARYLRVQENTVTM